MPLMSENLSWNDPMDHHGQFEGHLGSFRTNLFLPDHAGLGRLLAEEAQVWSQQHWEPPMCWDVFCRIPNQRETSSLYFHGNSNNQHEWLMTPGVLNCSEMHLPQLVIGEKTSLVSP